MDVSDAYTELHKSPEDTLESQIHSTYRATFLDLYLQALLTPRMPPPIFEPFNERMSMMGPSSSTPDGPKGPKGDDGFRRIIEEQKAEPDPIKREKGMAEGYLHHYFTSEAGFRVRLDEHQPTVSYKNDEGAVIHLPSSHVMLYRVEKVDTIDEEGKGKIHALSLYVHCKPSKGLFDCFDHILKGKADAGEFALPRAAFAILHMGQNISFFEYSERK